MGFWFSDLIAIMWREPLYGDQMSKLLYDDDETMNNGILHEFI